MYNSQNKSFKDTYQQVTDYVLEALEKGVAIWRKPWGNNGNAEISFPKNLTTQKAYKGWNHFFLFWVSNIYKFESPFFLTYLQAQNLGGHIKKGSKGFPIIKWVSKDFVGKEKNTSTGTEESVVRTKLIPVTHVVFNVEQTEKIHYPKFEPVEITPAQKIKSCEEIVVWMPDAPAIQKRGNRAFYSKVLDLVSIPDLPDFDTPEEYYSTLFHELIHSTGHQKRLDRQEIKDFKKFGDEHYSREELTAEMGAAYLCSIAGIEQKTIENSAAYMGGWLNALRDDKTLLIKAAAKAQAAADFILNKKEATPEAQPVGAGESA